jgi:hypothetical protein
VVAAGLALAGCGGDEPAGPLRTADDRLADNPRDPAALAAVIRAAHTEAQEHVDPDTGEYMPDARPSLDRAAAVWPRYVRATRGRVDGGVASVMSALYADGLKRPRDAADAQRLATEARPSAAGYVRLIYLYERAGDRRQALRAGRKAIALAGPAERDGIRHILEELDH